MNDSMIDFHSHILPKADHGSDSVDMSLRQLKLASDAGVNRIVATTHFYAHSMSVSSFLERRNASYIHLMHSAENLGVRDSLPEIRLGAEVLLCDGLDHLEDLKSLCLFGTNLLLLELPFTSFSPDFPEIADSLIRHGYEIILAHADRYDPDWISDMVSSGAKIQLNASAFSHLFVPGAVKEWMKDELVVALGSDIHKDVPDYYRDFLKARKRMGDYCAYLDSCSQAMWERSRPFPFD